MNEFTKDEQVSCDNQMSRKEFVTKILKAAAITGGVLASPKIIDSFIAPASAAGLSSCNASDTVNNGAHSDTNTASSTGDVATFPGSDTLCSLGD